MRFILWTLVYFGISELSTMIRIHQMGWDQYDKYYNSDIRGWAQLISMVIWIVCYVKFVKPE